MNERRRHFVPVQPLPYVPVTDNCKLIRRDSFAHAYMKAMGWTLLIEDGDNLLYQAPADFNETGTRAFA